MAGGAARAGAGFPNQLAKRSKRAAISGLADRRFGNLQAVTNDLVLLLLLDFFDKIDIEDNHGSAWPMQVGRPVGVILSLSSLVYKVIGSPCQRFLGRICVLGR